MNDDLTRVEKGVQCPEGLTWRWGPRIMASMIPAKFRSVKEKRSSRDQSITADDGSATDFLFVAETLAEVLDE